MAFNLVANLRLQGPRNLDAIVTQIQRGLQSVQANIALNVSSQSQGSIDKLNTSLRATSDLLSKIAVNAQSAQHAIAQLGGTKPLATKAISPNRGGGATIGGASMASQAKAAKQTSTEIKQIAKNTKVATDEMAEFGRISALAMRRYAGYTLTAGTLIGLSVAIRQGVGAAVDFERELIKVQQVTGRTRDGLSDLTTMISSLGKEFGVASGELIKVSRVLSQAGLTAKQTEIALSAIAKSDLAPTFDSMTQTTEGVIAAMRQFNIEASRVEGTLGSMNAVAGSFAVESGDLISAIRRTGGAFKAAGGDINELIALFTSVRATTRESADSIATGFRTIFTRMQRPRTIQFMKEFGIELQDVEGKFVGPMEAVRRLHLALKDLDPRDMRFARITEELSGFRQVSKVIPLIQQFQTANSALMTAIAGSSSIAEDASIAQDALAVKITKVKEAYNELFRDITGSDVFKSMSEYALTLATSLAKVLENLKPMAPLLASMAAISGLKVLGRYGTGFGMGLFPVGAKKEVANTVATAAVSTKAVANVAQQAAPTVIAHQQRTVASPTTKATQPVAAGAAINTKTLNAKLEALTKSVVNLSRKLGGAGLGKSIGNLSGKLTTYSQALGKSSSASVTAITANTAVINKLITTIGGLTAGRHPDLYPYSGPLQGKGRKRASGGPVRFASGGAVPGEGNVDKVNSLLMPGEFVVNKRAAQRVGYGTLHDINDMKYEDGGIFRTRPKERVNWGVYKAHDIAKQYRDLFQAEGTDRLPLIREFTSKEYDSRKDTFGIFRAANEYDIRRSHKSDLSNSRGEIALNLRKPYATSEFRKLIYHEMSHKVDSPANMMRIDKWMSINQNKVISALNEIAVKRFQAQFWNLSNDDIIKSFSYDAAIDPVGYSLQKTKHDKAEYIRFVMTERVRSREKLLWDNLSDRTQRKEAFAELMEGSSPKIRRLRRDMMMSGALGPKTANIAAAQQARITKIMGMKMARMAGMRKMAEGGIFGEGLATGGLFSGRLPKSSSVLGRTLLSGQQRRGSGFSQTGIAPSKIARQTAPLFAQNEDKFWQELSGIHGYQKVARQSSMIRLMFADMKRYPHKAVHPQHYGLANIFGYEKFSPPEVRGLKYDAFRDPANALFDPSTEHVLGFAGGGLVPGRGNKDDFPANLTKGEFVVRQAAVDKYGTEFLHSLNDMKVDGYAGGGGVAIPRYAKGGRSGDISRNVGRSGDMSGNVGGAMQMMFLVQMAGTLAQSFAEGNESFTKLISNTTQLASWFYTIQMGMGVFQSSVRALTGGGASLTRELSGVFGGKGMRPGFLSVPQKEGYASGLAGIGPKMSFGASGMVPTGIAARSGFGYKAAGWSPITSGQMRRGRLDELSRSITGMGVVATGTTAVVAGLTMALVMLGNSAMESAKKAAAAARTESGIRKAADEYKHGSGLTYAGYGVAAGAGLGAALGTMLLPGLGTVAGMKIGAMVGTGAGALAGGIGGYAIGSSGDQEVIDSLRKINRESRVDEAIDSLQTALTRLTSGDIIASGSTELADVGKGLEELMTARLQASFAGEKNEALAHARALRGMTTQLDQVKNSLLESVTTINEFENETGSGAQIIRALAQAQNMSVDDVRSAISEEIETRKNSVKLTNDANTAMAKLTTVTTALTKFQAAVTDTVLSLQRITTSMDAMAGLVKGDIVMPQWTGGPGFGDFSRITEGTVLDMRGYQSAMSQVFSGLGDDFGTFTSQYASELATVIDRLPEAFSQVSFNRSPLDNEQVAGAFADEVKNAFKDSGFNSDALTNVIDVMTSGIDKIAMGAGEGKGAGEVLKQMRADPAGFAKKVGVDEATIGGIFKQLDSIARGQLEAVKMLDHAVSLRVQVEMETLKRSQEVARQRLHNEIELFELTNRVPGKQFGLKRIQDSERARQEAVLKGTSLEGGDPFDIQAIGAALREVTKEFSATMEEQQNIGFMENTQDNKMKMVELSDKLGELNTQAQKFRTALEYMTDITDKAAEIRRTLNQLEEQEKTRYGILDRYTFESDEGRKKILQGIWDAVLVNWSKGRVTIDNIPGERRGAVGQMAKEFRSVPAMMFGMGPGGRGRTGAEAEVQMIESVVRRITGGGMPRGAEGLFGGTLTDKFQEVRPDKVSAPMQAQIDELKTLHTQRETATNELIGQLGTGTDELITKMKKEFENFVDVLVQRLTQLEVNIGQRSLEVARTKATELTGAKESIEKGREIFRRAGVEDLSDKGVYGLIKGLSTSEIPEKIQRVQEWRRKEFDDASLIDDISRVFTSVGQDKVLLATELKKLDFFESMSDEYLGQAITYLQSMEDGIRRETESWAPSTFGPTRVKSEPREFSAIQTDVKELLANGILGSIKSVRQTSGIVKQRGLEDDWAKSLTITTPQLVELLNKDIAPSIEKLWNAFGAIDAEQIGSISTELHNLSIEIGTLERQLKARGVDVDGGVVAENKASGGAIFRKQGSDTVPAMLTPGEFVVNRAAAKKNEALLKAINNGSNVENNAFGTQYAARGGRILPEEERRRLIQERAIERANARKGRLGRRSRGDIAVSSQPADVEFPNHPFPEITQEVQADVKREKRLGVYALRARQRGLQIGTDVVDDSWYRDAGGTQKPEIGVQQALPTPKEDRLTAAKRRLAEQEKALLNLAFFNPDDVYKHGPIERAIESTERIISILERPQQNAVRPQRQVSDEDAALSQRAKEVKQRLAEREPRQRGVPLINGKPATKESMDALRTKLNEEYARTQPVRMRTITQSQQAAQADTQYAPGWETSTFGYREMKKRGLEQPSVATTQQDLVRSRAEVMKELEENNARFFSMVPPNFEDYQGTYEYTQAVQTWDGERRKILERIKELEGEYENAGQWSGSPIQYGRHRAMQEFRAEHGRTRVTTPSSDGFRERRPPSTTTVSAYDVIPGGVVPRIAQRPTRIQESPRARLQAVENARKEKERQQQRFGELDIEEAWKRINTAGRLFHQGGLVPGSGNQPAVLQGGEFVVPRGIVQAMKKGGVVQARGYQSGGTVSGTQGVRQENGTLSLVMSNETKTAFDGFTQATNALKGTFDGFDTTTETLGSVFGLLDTASNTLSSTMTEFQSSITNLQTITKEFPESIRSSFNDVTSITSNLTDATSQFSQSSSNLTNVVAELSAITDSFGKFSETAGELKGTFSGFDTTANTLNATMTTFQSATATLQDTIKQFPESIKTAFNDVASTTLNLTNATSQFNQASSNLANTINELASSAESMRGAAIELRDALAQEVTISVTHSHEPVTVRIEGGASSFEANGDEFSGMVMRVVGPEIDKLRDRIRETGFGIA